MCFLCICLFVLHVLVFVLFLFSLVSGVGCGLWLWHSLDFSINFFPTLDHCFPWLNPAGGKIFLNPKLSKGYRYHCKQPFIIILPLSSYDWNTSCLFESFTSLSTILLSWDFAPEFVSFTCLVALSNWQVWDRGTCRRLQQAFARLKHY